MHINQINCFVLLFMSSATATYPKTKSKCIFDFVDKCEDSPYRTLDGSCNNLNGRTFGRAFSSFRRLVPPTYYDGIYSIPRQTDGSPYPSAREISNILFPPGEYDNKDYTLALMQIAQLIAHDMALSDGVVGGLGRSTNPVGCCASGTLGIRSNEEVCAADIRIPVNDPEYSSAGIQCLAFGRTRTTNNYFCNTQPYYEQINLYSSQLDMSFIYGSTVLVSIELREFSHGKLRGIMRNGQLWPPNQLFAQTNCVGNKNPFSPCYLMGDQRSNQNPQLTTLQLLMWREHNRIASVLESYNPNWTDEYLFQEARLINIAQWQHIVYTEILPRLLGPQTMLTYELINKYPNVCLNDYDDSLDLTVLQEFTAGAFRFFHTLIQGQLKIYNIEKQFLRNVILTDWISTGDINELDDEVYYDNLLFSLTMQPAAESDKFYTDDIKCRFAKKPTTNLGLDLISFDAERARDHGVGRYVDIRRVCKLSVPTTWEEMVGDLTQDTVYLLQKLYVNVESVEYLASYLEISLPGALVGPTNACILGIQFQLTRKGDRYFYDNCENKLSAEKLTVIKKSTLARLFCENSIIQKIQRIVTDVIGYSNPQVDCSDIPSLDLTLWKSQPEVVYTSQPKTYTHLIFDLFRNGFNYFKRLANIFW